MLFRVQCELCDKYASFNKKPEIHELKKFGFYYWGEMLNGNYSCTCDDCTKEIDNFRIKGGTALSRQKENITVYDLHYPPKEYINEVEFTHEDNPFIESFDETADIVHQGQEDKVSKILYREI